MVMLGRYIFSVTTAAIIFSILQSLLHKNSAAAILVRLIGGLFLTFTVIAPVIDFDLDSIFEQSWAYTSHAEDIAAAGQIIAAEQLSQRIKEQCETYIIDKAMSYQTQLDADITLTNDEMPLPSAVLLKGNISPYVKSIIATWIQDEMGIPEDHQIWSE